MMTGGGTNEGRQEEVGDGRGDNHGRTQDTLAETMDVRVLFDAQARPADSVELDATIDVDQSRDANSPHGGGATGAGLSRDFGDYQLLEEIARGGMGVVYRAWQKKANRTVAVKMILSGHLAGPEDVQRFHNEAEAAARLDHPNIVPIYHVGEHDGQHFFSMSYVDGQSLKQRVAEGPLPQRDAAEIIRAIAVAVAYAHSQGIIHRDLKPANVLLKQSPAAAGQGLRAGTSQASATTSDSRRATADLQPMITDFGLAKQVHADSDLTATGQIMGTPSYMSPEQAAGMTDQVGARSDVYSLGAMLYELLIGHAPFKAASALEVLVQVRQQEPVAPRHLNPKLSCDLETICLRCLEKDPNKRYPSAQDVADELERFLSGEPIQARPLGRLARTWRWCRRHRLAAGFIASAILLLLTAAAGGLIVGYQQSRLAAQLGTLVSQKNDLIREQAGRAAQQKLHAEQLANLAKEQQQLKQTAEFEAEKARHAMYGAAMSLAQQAVRDKRRESALELLDRFRPRGTADADLRGFDWHLLNRAADGLPEESEQTFNAFELPYISLDTSGGQGRVAAFSCDGKWLAAVGPGGTVRLWDMQIRPPAVVRDFSGGREMVLGVAFSRDGRRLAAATGSPLEVGPVLVWELSSGREICRLKDVTVTVQDLLFTHDNQQLLTIDGDAPVHGEVKFWDPDTGQLLRRVPGQINEIRGVAYGPDWASLAISGGWADSRGEARVIDPENGELIQNLSGPTKLVGRVAFSPDGTFLVSAEGFHQGNGCVRVFDVATGTERLRFARHLSSVYAVAISPDGLRIASGGSDRKIRVWDAFSGLEILELEGHSQEIRDLEFSPDGTSLVSVAHTLPWGFSNQADTVSEVFVWDAAPTPEPVICRGHSDRILDFCVLPQPGQDFPLLASLSADETARFWDLQTGGLSTGQSEYRIRYPGAIAGSPNGQSIVTAATTDQVSSTITVWNAHTGQYLRHTSVPLAQVTKMDVSPDGKLLALCGVSWGELNRIRVLRLSDLQPMHVFQAPEKMLSTIAFSPDGRYLAVSAGNYDATEASVVRLLDAQDGNNLHQLGNHRYRVDNLAFSPDGTRLVTAEFGPVDGKLGGGKPAPTIRQFAVDTGTLRKTIIGPTSGFTAIAHTPEKLIARQRNGVVWFFDAETGQPGKCLLDAPIAEGSIRVSADGRLLMTIGPEYTLRIWDAVTARPVLHGDLQPARPMAGTAEQQQRDSEQEDRELAELNAAVQANPGVPAPHLRRGTYHACRGHWSSAAADHARAVALDPESSHAWLKTATLFALAGDESGYKGLCADMLQQLGETQEIETAERVCKAALLGAWPSDHLDALPLEILGKSLDEGTAKETFAPWGYATRALAAYRQGDTEQAEKWARKAIDLTGFPPVRAMALAVLGMACQDLGRTDEADAALADAATLLPGELRSFADPNTVMIGAARPASVAHDWLVAEVLLRQAAGR